MFLGKCLDQLFVIYTFCFWISCLLYTLSIHTSIYSWYEPFSRHTLYMYDVCFYNKLQIVYYFQFRPKWIQYTFIYISQFQIYNNLHTYMHSTYISYKNKYILITIYTISKGCTGEFSKRVRMISDQLFVYRGIDIY